jgi:hypothetical protein
MIYFSGVLISLAAGYLLIRLLTAGRLNPLLHILLALVLGLGIDGTAAFYTHILFDQFNRWLPIGLVLLIIIVSAKQTLKKKIPSPAWAVRHDTIWGLLALGILAVPLAISAHYYPLGGWDAWSCWSLKAKFIFLGQENWKDVLGPGLWRSNTNYPLLWPLINVWFCDLAGRFDQTIPMLNSLLIALLTAGILLFGLLELTGKLWVSISATVLVTALPFNVTLFTSQYSDSLLGLFLLSAFMSFLLAGKYGLPRLKILSMVFLGLMSFTKNEGLIAAGITALGLFWQERDHKKELKVLIFTFLTACLPTVVFTLFFAPRNEAFINGLLSADKPTTWTRLVIILVYPWFEFISSKWNGFWLLVLGGVLLAGKRLWQPTIGVIGLCLILYLGVVLAYYAVNTFFEIGWWLQTTLSRILFALVPTIALWIGLAMAS